MANLRDVAARAGVSVATASRVASGSARVRPAHARARRARDARPPLRRARAAGRRPGRSGCSCPSSRNPVFPALAQAMEANATRAGLASILCNTAGSPNREADYVHMLLERRVDGMIFISSEVTDLRSDHGHYERLLDEGAKLVFVNGGSPALHVTSVGVDERAAGRLADRAPALARPRARRLRRRAGVHRCRRARSGRATRRRCSRPGSSRRTSSSRTPPSPSTAGARRARRLLDAAQRARRA